jgi:dynein heavy chain
MEFALKN